MRRTLLVTALLFAAIAVIGRDRRDGPASVATIARRVEALRDLRYGSLPTPQRVNGAEARRDGLADLDRGYPAAARRADETLYAMLGLLPEGTDLRDVSGSIFGQAVAGYYDPRSKRLKIVDGAGTANRVLDEMAIAHELDHALEDQAIGLDLAASERSDDAGYAYRALVEGTATAVMYAYVGRHFDSGVALGGLVGGAFGGTGTEGLPDFVVAGLVFPYLAGQRFVGDLYRRAGNRWTLVDLAERTRPPQTTEQILHPQKWIDAEPALGVRTPRAPGRGWRRLTAGTFGEWQTGRLVGQPRAAQGWGGDRYALYARGPRRRLVLRWRFDTAADLARFAPALRATARDLRGARVVPGSGRVTLVVSRA